MDTQFYVCHQLLKVSITLLSIAFLYGPLASFYSETVCSPGTGLISHVFFQAP